MDPERPSRRLAPSSQRILNPRKSRFVEVDVDSPSNTPPPFGNIPQWQIDKKEQSRTDVKENQGKDAFNTKSRVLRHSERPPIALRADSMTIRRLVNGTTLYTRVLMMACTMLIAVPLLFDLSFLGKAGPNVIGAEAGLIREKNGIGRGRRSVSIQRRDDSPTNVCNRWSHQSALINGTVYIYGGHTSQEPNQDQNTWTNDFVSVDVTKNFDISSPPLKGLPQPSGPPAVSNGYLWNSYSSLYVYGGEYSDKPRAYPDDFSLWIYDIASSSWSEKSNPKTSAGNNSDGGNQPVQRAAEGAGISVPELGRGFYFAGHLDPYTTKGWALPVPRVYLKSLLEYTFPGYANSGVESLGSGKKAGDDGVWRNITQGGIQDTARFTSRADSALVFVPGFGAQGILLSLGGGTNESFSQMNVIDVYDVATSTWYKQSTSGKYPILRVNPCAVAASAADGSSTNIYMYGGQNLIPADNQTQYGDMWILTIPSFTWISVDTDTQSTPPARVGHTCNLYNGQMVVVGGYTGKDLGCDSGFYVFNASALTWQNTYTALDGSDPLNQQVAQRKDPLGLGGSYGYQVPEPVISVIGGHASGGATVTAPAQLATTGPLATGKPVTYTVTGANGAVVTEVAGSPGSNNGGGGGSTGNGNGKGNGKSGPNIGAIVAGVVAGLFAILAAYLGFCTWVYRRQLKLYKNHVTMTQRHAAGTLIPEKSLFLSSGGNSSRQQGGSSTVGAASSGSGPGSGNPSLPPVPGLPQEHSRGSGSQARGMSTTANSSVEDLMNGQEPSFVGVLLNPRRSLRVINRD